MKKITKNVDKGLRISGVILSAAWTGFIIYANLLAIQQKGKRIAAIAAE